MIKKHPGLQQHFIVFFVPVSFRPGTVLRHKHRFDPRAFAGQWCIALQIWRAHKANHTGQISSMSIAGGLVVQRKALHLLHAYCALS